jgi:hypothetical protein
VTSPGRIAVFDCFSGIAGDMTLAALIDAGADLQTIAADLRRLEIPPFRLSTERVTRVGMRANYLRVEIDEECTYQPGEMREKVRAGGFAVRVEERALAAIDALAQAEATVHETAKADFHEVGGVDALIDIVGTMLALEALHVAEAVCPVVTVGAGTIARSAHGAIPAAPGPAAAEILRAKGFPLRFVEAAHELVTPTGAAILAAVARPGAATLTIEAAGAGAGTFDPPGRPNALRIFIGERTAPAPLEATRRLSLLEANIDDMPAVFIAHARDRLLEEGALDAWTEPIGMKKGRAATKLCALVPEGEEARIAAVFMAETTTLGVRTTPYSRFEAERRFETFESSLGPVRVKVSSWPGGERRTVEFEDVKALAARLGQPAWDVQRQLERELG